LTTLRFLNGLDTIGGNIVEIAQGDSRVIMDFGVTTIDPQLSIDNMIAQHQLPHLPELFHPELPDKFQHEAIFISHLHIDHMGALQYLQRDIPIYLSPDAYQLYQVLIAQHMEAPVANLHILPYEQPLTVGSLQVTGFASDHDTVGAMALLVDDGRQCFAHSGDVRLNGPHADRVLNWSRVLKTRRVKVFMLEGTTFSFSAPVPVEDADQPATPLTEATLAAKFQDLLHDQPATQFILNVYPRNVERLLALDKIARQADRPIIWEPEFAAVLHAFAPDTPLTTFGPDTMAAIQANPGRFVLQNSYAHLARLTALPRPAVYLHSNGEPLGDYDPRFAQLKDFLAAADIPFTFLSATGHAQRADLITLAERVHAMYVVPWHTFKPQAMADALAPTYSDVLLPERDLYYEF
jgi:ribonuclease J